MAWTNLVYAYASVLTSAKMTQNQDNFTALAQGLSGAPAIKIGAALDQSDVATTGSQSISDASSWVLPAGVYFCALPTAATYSMEVQIQVSGTWYYPYTDSDAASNLGFIISDGTNVRIYNNSGATKTVYYLKWN